MNNRKAKLEKALVKMQGHTLTTLASLHDALIEAIENLEDIQAWCRDRDASNALVYAVCLSNSTEALAKIDKALGEVRMTRKEKQGEGT